MYVLHTDLHNNSETMISNEFSWHILSEFTVAGLCIHKKKQMLRSQTVHTTSSLPKYKIEYHLFWFEHLTVQT